MFEFLKYEICEPIGERICSLFYKEEQAPKETETFHSVSQYLADMEKVILELLEERPPQDRTITLWWGLDGLRLNEDGSIELVSRRKQTPVQPNVFWQLNQSILPVFAGMPGVYTQNMSGQNVIDGTINTLERELANFQVQTQQTDLIFQQLAQTQKKSNPLPGCCCNFRG